MYLFQGCHTLLRNAGTKHTARYTPPPKKISSYEQRTQKLENLDIALTYCQEKNNAGTGMYKFKKKSSSSVKILGDRTVTRSKSYKGGSQILGVEPGICTALGYETNVNYRLQNNCCFKVDLKCRLREHNPVRLTYEGNINMSDNNKILQKHPNGESTINFMHTRLKMS
jgi:hypothetical protein